MTVGDLSNVASRSRHAEELRLDVFCAATVSCRWMLPFWNVPALRVSKSEFDDVANECREF